MKICFAALFLFSFAFLSPHTPMAQSSGRLDDLYRYVEQTDSLIDHTEKSFYLEKFLKDDYNYRESWRYTTRGDRIVFFQVDYMIDSTEYTEVYYLQKGSLVCSEEYEKVNYSYLEDELKWGGIYYFQSSLPKHVVTLGRKKDYEGRLSGESQAIARFEKRYSELKRHLPMLP